MNNGEDLKDIAEKGVRVVLVAVGIAVFGVIAIAFLIVVLRELPRDGDRTPPPATTTAPVTPSPSSDADGA